MSIEKNKAVVRRFAEECWNAGMLDVLDELVADDIVRSGYRETNRVLAANARHVIHEVLDDHQRRLTDVA